jgi:hypothetical protein
MYPIIRRKYRFYMCVGLGGILVFNLYLKCGIAFVIIGKYGKPVQGVR